MMRFDFMNVVHEVAQAGTTNVKDDSASCHSNQGVGKHPRLDTSDPQSTEPPAKRIRPTPLRISCKARGLSERHNADNAYLEIPAGAPHGLPLSCSEPECASSGRRFRYCQVCGVPVAKRNFLQRHGHGMVSTSLQLRNDVDNYCQPCGSSGETPQASDVNASDELRIGIIPDNAGHRRDVSVAVPSCQEYHLDFREKKWLTLLHERPNVYDPTRMTSWLNKVLSFSDNDLETSRNDHNQTFPSAMSCIDVHAPFVFPTSESANEAVIPVATMEQHTVGPSRNAPIQTLPSATSCFDVHGSLVSSTSESEYDASFPLAALERHIFGPSGNGHIQTLPSAMSGMNGNGPFVSSTSQAVYDTGTSLAAMERHNFGLLRNAQMQTCPLSSLRIDGHGALVSHSSEAGGRHHNAGMSLVTMEPHKFGNFTHSSFSAHETGNGQNTQERSKVTSESAECHDLLKGASEMAEFHEFMNGIDTSFVFV